MQYYLSLFIKIFCDLLSMLIVIRILMSWFPGMGRGQRIVLVINDVTDPVLKLAKRITPNTGMFDFSPLVALIGLDLLKALILYFFNSF